MKELRICFIGLGSIGNRHLQNMVQVLSERNYSFTIDAVRTTLTILPDNIGSLIQTIYYDTEDISANYDVIFITNPTYLHTKTLQQVKDKTNYVFIEKPISHTVDSELLYDEYNSQNYYVACPLRYTNVIQYLKKYCEINSVIAVRSICSTYLPEWRTAQDYRQSYSAKENMGGGVLLDLIHEWDYLVYLFGFPVKTKKISGKYSSLEITSEDIGVYIAQYPDFLLSLHLDYFGRVNKRQIELFTNDDVIIGDLITSTVTLQKANQVIDFSENRNEYQKKELEYFVDIIEGKEKNNNSVSHATQVLKIALGE